jgi:hypothetical protein
VQAIYLPDLVDGEDVRMVQRRGGARLLLEATQAVAIMRKKGG